MPSDSSLIFAAQGVWFAHCWSVTVALDSAYLMGHEWGVRVPLSRVSISAKVPAAKPLSQQRLDQFDVPRSEYLTYCTKHPNTFSLTVSPTRTGPSTLISTLLQFNIM